MKPLLLLRNISRGGAASQHPRLLLPITVLCLLAGTCRRFDSSIVFRGDSAVSSLCRLGQLLSMMLLLLIGFKK
jgi:hypothetical protein